MAATTLQVFYSKMLHLMCAAYRLYRVSEQVVSLFRIVNKSIATVKHIFKIAQNQVQLFKNELFDINLPPESIFTRWETWINADVYYCEIYKLFMVFIDYSIQKMRIIFIM